MNYNDTFITVSKEKIERIIQIKICHHLLAQLFLFVLTLTLLFCAVKKTHFNFVCRNSSLFLKGTFCCFYCKKMLF